MTRTSNSPPPNPYRRRKARSAWPPGATTARGYGTPHQRLRKVWAPKVERGEVACWRCGRTIHPGQPWDLGHDDHDRSITRGPEHRRENRATAGRRKRGWSRRRQSEDW